MPSAKIIRVAIFIASAVFVGATWVATGRPDTEFLRFVSLAVVVVCGAFALWEHWLWRLRGVQSIKRVPPNINGTWRCNLQSSYRDPATNQVIEGRVIFLVVRQSFSMVRVALLSSESDSKSMLARLGEEDGTWVLHYIYTNTPEYSVRDRSDIHHGSGVLKVIGRPSTRLTGGYWTDRQTRGDITSVGHDRGHADDYQGAANAFPNE